MSLIKLHLGCGDRKIAGFINIDIREDVRPDIVDNAFELTKFENNSVDLIYSSHMLEHLSRKDSMRALQRWFAVLKTGGVLRLSVPDLQAVFEYYMFSKDLDTLFGFLYGSQKYFHSFHYMGWDERTLRRDLELVGFENIKKYNWRNTEHFYVDDYSMAMLPKISYNTRRQDGTIEGKQMSLNVEATK
jgi:predicted SAM-dependent methyltransferase